MISSRFHSHNQNDDNDSPFEDVTDVDSIWPILESSFNSLILCPVKTLSVQEHIDLYTYAKTLELYGPTLLSLFLIIDWYFAIALLPDTAKTRFLLPSFKVSFVVLASLLLDNA